MLNIEIASFSAKLQDAALRKQHGSDLEDGVQLEQVRLLCRALPAAFAANALFALILVSVLLPVIAPGRLFAWLATIAATLVANAALAAVWHRGRANAANFAQRRLLPFRIAAVTTGLAWGAAALLLFPAGDALHQVFLAFIVAGVSVGGVALLAVDRFSMLGFLLPMMMPLAVRYGIEGKQISLSMAVMIALYLIFATAGARRVGRKLRENARLRIEALERERILRSRNEELNSVVEKSPDNIIRYDLNCRAVYVNRMMEKTVNVTAVSLIGKTPVESRFDGLSGVENY